MQNISRKTFLQGAVGGAGLVALGTLASYGNQAFAETADTFTFADTVEWAAEYDVVVLGMGAAGMVSAKTAAENGASVLIVEKCEEGEAGGNSKVCGQMFAWGHQDPDNTKAYYQALSGGRELPEAVLDTIVDGVANIAEILETELGMDASEFWVLDDAERLNAMSPEYPELPGSETMSLMATHHGTSDSYYFQHLKSLIVGLSDSIDVWYNSPAVELIQDPVTKTIVGVKVERDGQEMNVRALNGVCLCTGGFEANREMVQHYLNVINYAPVGSLYNTGDGIRMAQRAGADLWHMNVYEGLFGLGGVSWNVGEDAHGIRICSLLRNALNTGATILVGTDGERFLNESEIVRHGHMYENGIWENPTYPEKIWYIFDGTQKELIDADSLIPEEFVSQIMEFDSIDALAVGIECDPVVLSNTIENFNTFAETGVDLKAGREAEFMRPFDGEKYYAMYMLNGILNTQGGPKRNENAEVVDLDGNPIPHLYSAGECGGVTVCMYQGGTNMAECLVFGLIAGANAAAEKEPLPAYVALTVVESTPATLGQITDINTEVVEYEAAENQYIGTGAGIGGDVVVRVTMDGATISDVEVLKEDETPDVGGRAIEQLPPLFSGLSSAEEIEAVDTVSGATVTSKALKAAVVSAMSQAS